MWEFVKPDTHFFTPTQRKQVEALFEAILPGSDANAVEYIDTLLTMDHDTYYAIPQMRTLYPVGLLVVEDAARRMFTGRGIADLTLDERTQLLDKLAAGKIEGTSFAAADQQRFFNELRTRCIEGCFADTRWDGNRDSVMWKWYGWTVPPQEFRRKPATEAAGPPLKIKGETRRGDASVKPKPARRRART